MKLPKEALAKLPAPDGQGMVRVTATIKVSPDGEVEVLELNDHPVGADETDDAEPMPAEEMPNLAADEAALYQ